MAEYVVEQERYLNPVPPDLRDIAVLAEPLTIAEKALLQIFWMMQQRPPWLDPQTPVEEQGRGLSALVLGIGPVGLLGAMVLVSAGFTTYIYSRELPPSPRIDLAEAIGASYVSSQTTTFGELAEKIGNVDLVYEAVGHSHFALQALRVLGTNGIFVLTGVPGLQDLVQADPARLIRDMVLKNQVLLGTVNAGPDAFAAALRDLQRFRRQWPEVVRTLIAGRYPPEQAADLIMARPPASRASSLSAPPAPDDHPGQSNRPDPWPPSADLWPPSACRCRCRTRRGTGRRRRRGTRRGTGTGADQARRTRRGEEPGAAAEPGAGVGPGAAPEPGAGEGPARQRTRRGPPDRPGGLADDQLARQPPQAVTGPPVDGGQQFPGGQLAEFLEAHVHAGQRRARGAGEDLPVVVADQRDVVGHPAARFTERVRDAPGQLVAAAEDRLGARRGVQHGMRRVAAPFLAPLPVQHLAGGEVQPGFGQHLPRPGMPAAARTGTGPDRSRARSGSGRR